MVIGSPATFVSGNFTVRRITEWKTVSPNAWTTRSSCLTAVQSTRVVHGAEDAESRACIEAILHFGDGVGEQSYSLQSEELAHSSGMITLSAAVNALM